MHIKLYLLSFSLHIYIVIDNPPAPPAPGSAVALSDVLRETGRNRRGRGGSGYNSLDTHENGMAVGGSGMLLDPRHYGEDGLRDEGSLCSRMCGAFLRCFQCDAKTYYQIFCFSFVPFIVVFSCSWDTVEPTEYGLKYNQMTGNVHRDTAYGGGRYIVGPFTSFIKFPATNILLEYSARKGSQSEQIQCRTGRDGADPDSGGQPLNISLALYYTLKPDKIGHVYTLFGEDYEARFTQFAQMAVVNTAQQFNPTEFWTKRNEVAQQMKKAIHNTLEPFGADVVELQLLYLGFLDRFEDTIVDIQLAVQMRTTKEYYYSVMQMVKEIDILGSQTNSSITQINANATAAAIGIVNNATCLGFNTTQSAKSVMYSGLTKALEFDNSAFLQYVKIKSIKDHQSSNLTLGLQSPFDGL